MRILTVVTLLFLLSLTVSSQRKIRSVDFRNFEYSAYCAADKPFKVKVSNGEFLHHGNESVFDYLRFWVHSVEYGDLDGDSKDEAVVILVCHPGGTGKFSEGLIFSPGTFRPRIVGRFSGGDRAAGGLVSAVVRDGHLVVERNEEDGGGLCCPNTTFTSTHRFLRGQLEENGTGVRKELYPATRLEFVEPGKDLVFQATVDYKNRYVLLGNKGQILSVTTNQSNAPIYQFKGGERIDDGMAGLKSRFDKEGDIVFHIHNNEDYPRAFVITVRIIDPPLSSEFSACFKPSWKTNVGFWASFINYEEIISCIICGDIPV